MSTETDIAPPPSPRPSPGVPGDPAIERTSGSGASLTLLREWQSICDSIDAGRDHLLIRKGGIADGRAGFELKKNFFGLLPTLFHQVTHAEPDAEVPEPPRIVSLICQRVDAFVVPSITPLDALADLHAYSPEQLEARQQFKTERPLHLLIVRPFRLKAPIEIAAGAIAPSCKSWVELPLTGGMGGIEPVSDVTETDRTIEALRAAIATLADVRRLDA